MAPQFAMETSVSATGNRWSLATRLAFRFCFLYFGLFCLTTQIFGGLFSLPVIEIPDLSVMLRPVIFWTASHLFSVPGPLVYTGSGSGDKTFDWVLCFVLLVLAAAGAAIWAALDRRRESYPGLQKWFRLAIRLALGTQMLSYGIVKLVPLQMPFPYLTRLVEPYGNFSPMGVLWASIGASPGYEMFAGSAEVLAGILLLIPRTAFLGALICLTDTVQIFELNMTYDVPVKLFSFHLLLMSAFLLAPEMSRLVRFFLLNRTVERSSQPALFTSAKRNRWALAVQLLFLAWQLGINLYGARQSWTQYGGGSQKSPLYGIWNVEENIMGGEVVQPLPNDHKQWRRVIFDRPTSAAIQRMDDSTVSFSAVIDTAGKTIALTGSGKIPLGARQQRSKLTFERVGQDQLILDGNLNGNAVHMRLRLQDRGKFVLVSRGFHWIQEYPYNH